MPEWIDCGDAPYAGGTVLESAHTLTLAATPEQVWNVLVRLGGDEGWLYGDWLWKIRGLADKLIGGPGLRRGRRHPDELRVGDALDFWRVLVVEENRRLRLLAEMKLPGEALLQFDVEEEGLKRTRLTLRARFLPRGLWGIVYWYSSCPAHTALSGHAHGPGPQGRRQYSFRTKSPHPRRARMSNLTTEPRFTETSISEPEIRKTLEAILEDNAPGFWPPLSWISPCAARWPSPRRRTCAP
jgi:hypothetical protein